LQSGKIVFISDPDCDDSDRFHTGTLEGLPINICSITSDVIDHREFFSNLYMITNDGHMLLYENLNALLNNRSKASGLKAVDISDRIPGKVISMTSSIFPPFLCINDAGQLFSSNGFGSNVSFEEVMPGLQRVTQVSDSYTHNLAITEDGSVYSWSKLPASPFSSVLGLGAGAPFQAKPRKLERITDAIQVFSGNLFGAILTKTGEVYVFGQISDSRHPPIFSPRKVDGLEGEKIIRIANSTQNILVLVAKSGKQIRCESQPDCIDLKLTTINPEHPKGIEELVDRSSRFGPSK
jgi:hypothetical protein